MPQPHVHTWARCPVEGGNFQSARTVGEIGPRISKDLEALGLYSFDSDVAEIHVLSSGQHGGFDIEIVYAVEVDD